MPDEMDTLLGSLNREAGGSGFPPPPAFLAAVGRRRRRRRAVLGAVAAAPVLVVGVLWLSLWRFDQRPAAVPDHPDTGSMAEHGGRLEPAMVNVSILAWSRGEDPADQVFPAARIEPASGVLAAGLRWDPDRVDLWFSQ